MGLHGRKKRYEVKKALISGTSWDAMVLQGISKELLAQWGITSEEELRKALEKNVFGSAQIHNSSSSAELFDYVKFIYSYLEHLQTTRNANDVTINTYLKALRTILYYFMEEGYMQSFKIELVRVENEIKETYTEEELEKLLRKPDIKKCNFSEFRCWVMANYLLGTGNRIRTAINVKIEHLDFINRLILLGKTKNGRQQLIPMSEELAGILQEYLLYRKGQPEDYLFCSIHGTQLTRMGLHSRKKQHEIKKEACLAFLPCLSFLPNQPVQDNRSTRFSHVFRYVFWRSWIWSKRR